MKKMSNKGGDNEESKSQACWKYLTISEKILLSLLLIVITICLALFGFTVSLLMKTKSSCQSTHCIKSVTNLLESGDFISTDPCTNFYDFVCGNFMKDSVEKNKISPLEEQINIINHQRTIALTKAEHTRFFYETCINSGSEDNIILNLLQEIGGWPILLGQNWKKKYVWFEFIVKLQNMSLPSEWLIDFELDADTNKLKINPPRFPLSVVYQNYSKVLFNISTELGASEIISYYQIKNIEQFEKNLIQCTIHDKNETSIELTLDQLSVIYPQIPWFEFLKNYSNGVANFTNNTLLILNAKQYLNKLNLLLLETPHITQINYLVWKVLEYFLPFFNESYRLKYFNPNNFERTDYCWYETFARFENDIQKFYLKNSLQNKHLEAIEKMIEYHKDQMIIQVTKIPWINVTLKRFAIEKLRKLQFIIDILMYEKLQNEKMFITQSKLSLMDMLQLQINKRTTILFRNMNQNITRSLVEYLPDSMKLELLFDWNENIAIIPIDLIQDFWYNDNRPNYLNYGSLGTIIAEQFSKEVAKLLIFFNEENVTEKKKIFSRILNYNETTGENSLEEQFSITISLNLAYLAYQEWIRNNGVEQKLLGLDFETEQLFWIQMAYLHCSKEPRMSVLVNDKIRYSLYFAKNFNCHDGSEMNSKKTLFV